MIKKFALCWDINKNKLKKHLRTHNQDEYSSYEELVKLIFDIVINPEIRNASGILHDGGCEFDTKNISVIDDGYYQGTQIFILHRNTYQPDMGDYVHTHVYYGSCSGCDTLLGINCYMGDIPSERQVEAYMTLCLHLLQNCKWMADIEEDEEVKND